MRSVELFAGAGGLAIGLSRAGFHPELLVEWDADSYQTLLHNKEQGLQLMERGNILKADVREVDYSEIKVDIDLVTGGPPCQPFSIGGKHTGHADRRNLWPEAIRAVRELMPRAFLFENVAGLLRPTFSSYLRYITLHLEMPTMTCRSSERWDAHLRQLERIRLNASLGGERLYKVFVHPVDAANYGAPQRRRRVIIVGLRWDQQGEWTLPRPTHSRETLLWDQWVSSKYWDKHRVPRCRRPTLSADEKATIDSLVGLYGKPPGLPWQTVRDAIADLERPLKNRETFPNHKLWPGAKIYPGHTGSKLDEPAKTLKAGDHGVPGGENMLVLPDGSVRYFSVREAARLQGFPDEFLFPRSVSWTECMRQIGNAVPVPLAECFGQHLNQVLTITRKKKTHAA